MRVYVEWRGMGTEVPVIAMARTQHLSDERCHGARFSLSVDSAKAEIVFRCRPLACSKAKFLDQRAALAMTILDKSWLL